MSHRDFEVDPTDPKYISGIFNYCDRWCERCPFTARCSVFALEMEMEAESTAGLEDRDRDNAAFWDQLTTVFAETRIVLNHFPEDEEIDELYEDDDEFDDDPDLALFAAQEQAREEEIDQHPLSIASYAYAKGVHDWFEEHAPLFPDGDAKNLTPAEQELADAVSVVQWYEFQIHVKLRRALECDDEREDHLADQGFQKDSDGSAKVALIGMDRSIAAWARIRCQRPVTASQATAYIQQLELLRRQTEAAFPDARAFKRPGFDTDMPAN